MRKLVVLFCTAFMCVGAYAQDASNQTAKLSPEQQAIRKNAEAFVAAFDAGDAKGVAALWTDNGEMSLRGDAVAVGRKQIEASYAEYFKENDGARIEVQIDSIRVLGPGLAIERGHSEVINDADESVVDSYRLVYTKRGDNWLIVSADVQQEVIEASVDWKAELGFLVGKWSVSEGDWTVTSEFEWLPGGNFLKRTFSTKDGDEEPRAGTQVIGWDAREQAITSWTFGADGGHGRGWWSRGGDQWHVQSEGVSPQGEVIAATNILTILSDDTFRWQSIDRSINGIELEDTEPVRVKRVTSGN